MTNILPAAEWQIVDDNGVPLVGGTVGTYIPGTLMAKATWQDAGQVTQNPNPLALDAAGRCIMWGNGDYRVVVRDALGNLVYDQITGSALPESAVSPVMLPVLGAGTLAEARRLMGIDDAIEAALIAALGADNEASLRAAADAALQAEIDAAVTAQAAINAAEAAARAAGDAALQSQIDTLAGIGSSIVKGGMAFISGGHCRVTFPTPFPHACTAICCMLGGSGAFVSFTLTASPDVNGADVLMTVAGTNIPATEGGFFWIATGN